MYIYIYDIRVNLWCFEPLRDVFANAEGLDFFLRSRAVSITYSSQTDDAITDDARSHVCVCVCVCVCVWSPGRLS